MPGLPASSPGGVSDPLLILWAALATPTGGFKLRVLEDGRWRYAFVRVDEWRRLQHLAAWFAERRLDCEIAAPSLHDGIYGVWACHALWLRLESAAQARQTAKVLPSPTIVLRRGSTVQRVCVWALTAPLHYRWAERGMRRMAHAVGSPKKWTNPETFWFPLPGSGMWRASFVGDELYGARELFGGLREAPNPNAWRERES